MADRYPLSEGTLSVIMSGGNIENPIMQVLGSKKMAAGKAGDKERYRILLSDGKYLISFAMLSTQINNKVGNGEIPVYSIIKIKKYVTSIINNTGNKDKRVLVILDLDILVSGDEVGSQIGKPEQLSDTPQAAETSNNLATSSNHGVVNGQSSNTYQQQKPTYYNQNSSNSLNTSMNNSLQNQLTHPISSLSPYQNKWVIKARVSNKSAIRTWSNSKGEGKLFSMDLVDESGEIRATAFRDLVDKFYDMIEVDKVYYISKCQLKIANKQFCTLKNDYEMTFTNETVVQECHDADPSIPQSQYNFIPIEKIAHIADGTYVDVIGICKSTSDLITFQAKSTGREMKKREVQLVDQSNNAIELTLWGGEAENFDGSSQPVVVVKGAKITEWGGGKTLTASMGSVLKINPDLPESHRLRGWFDNGGMGADSTNISAKSSIGFSTPWMCFREVQDQGLGSSDKGDYYQNKATVLLAKSENALYKACPTEQCNKKVIDMQNGMYRCEKCNREYPNFKYRLLASMNLADWSGNQWVTMFSSEAEKIFDMTSQEVGEATETNPEAMINIADKANFKNFIFKCRAKIETYNDEARLKTVVIKVDPINHKDYNAYLISKIQQNLPQ